MVNRKDEGWKDEATALFVGCGAGEKDGGAALAGCPKKSICEGVLGASLLRRTLPVRLIPSEITLFARL